MESKKQKKEYTVALGGLFILLALIGLVTIIVSSVRLTKNLMDNTRQKEAFEKLLRPVVMFDPVPFNNPQEIDSNRLLLYAMWAVLSDSSVNDYPRSEDSSVLLVPASDVGERARLLFGSEVTPKHATFTDNEKAYFYDEAHTTYEVATYGYLYVNQPEVLSIARDGDYYRLLISYIPPANAWETIFAGTSTETFSRKTMYYIVKTVDDGWNLVTIMEPPRDAVEVDFKFVPVPYVAPKEPTGPPLEDGVVGDGDPEDEITATGTQPVLPVPLESEPEVGVDETAPGVANPETTETTETTEIPSTDASVAVADDQVAPATAASGDATIPPIQPAQQTPPDTQEGQTAGTDSEPVA